MHSNKYSKQTKLRKERLKLNIKKWLNKIYKIKLVRVKNQMMIRILILVYLDLVVKNN